MLSDVMNIDAIKLWQKGCVLSGFDFVENNINNIFYFPNLVFSDLFPSHHLSFLFCLN